MVPGNEELRVAERLHRADAHDDLLSGPLRGVNLPVELSGIEAAGPALDAVPVGAQPNQLERVAQQRGQGGHGIKPEGLGLQRAEADPDPRLPARLDGHLLPAVGDRSRGTVQPELRQGRQEEGRRCAHPAQPHHESRSGRMADTTWRARTRLAMSSAISVPAAGCPSRAEAERIASTAARS